MNKLVAVLVFTAFSTIAICDRRHEGVEVLTFSTAGGDWSGFDKIMNGIRDQTNPARLYAESIRDKRILYVTRSPHVPPKVCCVISHGSSIVVIALIVLVMQESKPKATNGKPGVILPTPLKRSASWWIEQSAWNDGKRLAKFLSAASQHIPEVRSPHCYALSPLHAQSSHRVMRFSLWWQ